MKAAFVWRVASSGYCWETPAAPWSGGPVLTVNRPWPSHEYEPLERYTGLFRAFAGLPAEPEAMLKFAGRYGHLGEFIWVFGTAFDEARERDAEVLNAAVENRVPGGARFAGRERPETLDFWTAQIESMRAAVELWDRIRAGKADPDEGRRVSEAIGSGAHDRFEVRYRYDRATKRFGWETTPTDLIGAMWMQLSDAVANNLDYRRCAVCADWFEVAPGAGRADKQHCSPDCRHKAYRDRKKRALELHALKLTPEQIAGELGSDPDVVRRWLKGHGRTPPPTDEDNPSGTYRRAGLDL